jgi:hypothetical protein
MAQTAQTAHVYETSEPFHTASVWAAGDRQAHQWANVIDVYPSPGVKPTSTGLSLGSWS